MILANTPPAIVKERDELLKLTQRAWDATEEFRSRPDAVESREKLAACRDELDRRLGVFLDGDLSIENAWRRICESHVEQGTGAFEGETERVQALFDQHLQILQTIQAQKVFHSLAELGFAVPRFAQIEEAIETTEEIRDRVLDRWPLTDKEFYYAFPVDVEEVIYISPGAYLRSMLAIIWCAFRHPFSTSYVDLSTGAYVTLTDEDTWER